MSEVEGYPDRRSSVEERRRVNLAGLLELLDAHDKKHDEAHRRLRHDFRELEERHIDGLKALAEKQSATAASVKEISLTPIDAAKLVFTPKIVLSVIGIVVTIYGGIWAQNSGLRSDVRDILTQMAAEKRVADVNAKLLEVNNATIKNALENNSRELKDAIASVTKRQDLLTLQYNQLSEQLTRLTAQRER